MLSIGLDKLKILPSSSSEHEDFSSNCDNEIITPQVLASYCWRSMKEIFLILGSISHLSQHSIQHQLHLEMSSDQVKQRYTDFTI